MKDYFYIIMNQTEDGLYIDQLTREELNTRLNEKWWGDHPVIHHELPKFSDGYFNKEGVIILECVRLVQPREVKTVTSYVVD